MRDAIRPLPARTAGRPPPLFPFGFDTATVVATYPGRAKLRFDASGLERMTAPLPAGYPHRLEPGARVTASWHWLRNRRPPPGIPTLIAPEAIEPVGYWDRDDRHVTLYPETANAPGKAEEHAYVDALRARGIRTEHATVYEDEELHVDAWAFLPFDPQGRWDWIPVDLTLAKYEMLVRKQRTAHRNGVLLVPADAKDFDGPATILVIRTLLQLQDRIRLYPETEFMSRHAARLREAACPTDRKRTYGRP